MKTLLSFAIATLTAGCTISQQIAFTPAASTLPICPVAADDFEELICRDVRRMGIGCDSPSSTYYQRLNICTVPGAAYTSWARQPSLPRAPSFINTWN